MIPVRLVQLLLIAIPGVLFGWLLHQELVPTGAFVADIRVGEDSPFIHRLLPDDRVGPVRVDEDGDTVQSVVGDPAFFFVHPHRSFERVEAEIFFKNEREPILELGGLAQAGEEVYDLKPLHNRVIDELPWTRLRDGRLVLLQKEPMYASVREFLENPPPRHEIATSHFSLSEPYLIRGYAASPVRQAVDVSLRGFHAMKTYVKDETLSFEIDYMDMNRAEGADPVQVLVTNEDGRLVGEAGVPDDGDRGSLARPSAMKRLSLTIPGLSEGVYKVELRAGRDIFFRRIDTAQEKLVFLNNLYLADEVGYQAAPRSVRFWTEAKDIAFMTQHAEGIQTVAVGAHRVAIEEPYARYAHAVPEDGVVAVTVPKGDALVYSDGHIAFSPGAFFNPDPVVIRANTDLAKLGVKYVIAEYVPPREENGWLVATASFDAGMLTSVSDDKTIWKFAFSIPGVAERDGQVDIGRIRLTFAREPLTMADVLGWFGTVWN